jgi:hypothetical protein
MLEYERKSNVLHSLFYISLFVIVHFPLFHIFSLKISFGVI